MVACGVAMLVSSFGTYRSLQRARDELYAATGFADVFVRLTRAPDGVAAELGRVDGVAGVETRLGFDVPLSVEGVAAPVSARVLSLPPPGARRGAAPPGGNGTIAAAGRAARGGRQRGVREGPTAEVRRPHRGGAERPA